MHFNNAIKTVVTEIIIDIEDVVVEIEIGIGVNNEDEIIIVIPNMDNNSSNIDHNNSQEITEDTDERNANVDVVEV